jgi:hypothetical protein
MSKLGDLLSLCDGICLAKAYGTDVALDDAIRRRRITSIVRGIDLVDAALVRGLRAAPRGLVKR